MTHLVGPAGGPPETYDMFFKDSTRAAGRAPSLRMALGLCVLALGLAACGHDHPDHEGYMLVDNRTDLTTNELLLAFRVAPFQEPFTGDLLGADLAPADAVNLGVFHEDYYDAEGDLELGQLIEWFDTFVGYEETTVFEVR